jgi:RNA-binding protein
MRRAGEVVGVAQGMAIVRAPDETHPDIGVRLVEQDLSTAGQVVDVFGPVEQPFLVVDTMDSPAALLGARLYSE